jgi:hypothetical protein
MTRRLKVTEQKYNTIRAQLKKNSGRKIGALHQLSGATISYIKNSTSYSDYLYGHRPEKQLDKITQANPIKRLDDVAPVSTALEQIAKLRARIENLEDAWRIRANEEFHLEAAQETRGWFHWLRKGN